MKSCYKKRYERSFEQVSKDKQSDTPSGQLLTQMKKMLDVKDVKTPNALTS